MPCMKNASNSTLMSRGTSMQVLASVRAVKLAACCRTKRYGMVSLGAVALGEDRCAVRRLLGAADRWLAREAVARTAVPSRALRLHRPVCRRPVCAHCCGALFEDLDMGSTVRYEAASAGL
jgi:hypothetical protein